MYFRAIESNNGVNFRKNRKKINFGYSSSIIFVGKTSTSSLLNFIVAVPGPVSPYDLDVHFKSLHLKYFKHLHELVSVDLELNVREIVEAIVDTSSGSMYRFRMIT